MENTNVTHELSKDISKMIEDGKKAEEIRKAWNVRSNTFRHWLEQLMLTPPHFLDSPFLKLRTAILERGLKDTNILKMLHAATEPSEATSDKTVILSEL